MKQALVTSRITFQLSFLLTAARMVAPSAPTPLASVGVVIPAKMEPNTAIISRAGEGSKMVLTGDPYQIDNPYLDASSNGLTYAAERLKGHRVHGHVLLTNSERSELAAIAAECL